MRYLVQKTLQFFLNYPQGQKRREKEEHYSHRQVKRFDGDLLQDPIANNCACKGRKCGGNKKVIIDFWTYFQNVCGIDRKPGDVDEDRNYDSRSNKDFFTQSCPYKESRP